jgi:hypothetical protein
MKHFTQYIQLLRAAWEGDRQRAAEQLLALADQMEGEGDAAHARMLRFTLQALQSHPSSRDDHTLMRPAVPAKTTGCAASVLDVDLGRTSPALGSVALTFGTWDETRH